MPVPPVDPDNEEFIIFVRSAKNPIAQWFPFNIVIGGSSANAMVQQAEAEWVSKLNLKKFFDDTLTKNIGKTIYADIDKITEVVTERVPMLKGATDFEFAYKVRDKSRPAAWVFTDGITVIPSEDECKGLLDYVNDDPDKLVAAATDAMVFSAAPEIINGRLAMLGFVAAFGAELASGKSVVAQMSMDQPQILFHFALFAAASLIPIMKGAKEEEFGPLTPKAELLNGRAAMIGFALLLVLEGSSGSAFF